MSWMTWAAIGSLLAAFGCFLRGAFKLSWDALPWMLFGMIGLAFAFAFGLSAAFS